MKKFPALALGLALLSAPALADLTTVGPVLDNTLYESATGALSNAKGPEFYVGRANNGLRRRGLVAFDLSAIPPGSTVQSVSLSMFCTGQGLNDAGNFRVIGLHRVGQPWGEGTSNAFVPGGSGAPSTPGDATWIHTYYSGSTWLNAGGDYFPFPSATASVGGVGGYTWVSNPTLIADVQGWVDNPATNAGWLVLGDESTNGTGRGFASREGSSSPSLSIFFTPPTVTTYCTGKTNSLACVPFVTFIGGATATGTAPFQLTMNDSIPGEAGFVIYSFKKANLNFHAGKLCVKSPFERTGAKNPKNPGGGCSGWILRRNFNATIQSGLDPSLTAGRVVTAQWRQRDPADPAGFGDALTDGLRFTILP
jgi:hypothetical protein